MDAFKDMYSVKDPATLSADEIAVVGKVEFVPALREGEQKAGASSLVSKYNNPKNRIYLRYAKDWFDIKEEHIKMTDKIFAGEDYKEDWRRRRLGDLPAMIGEVYIFRAFRNSFYIAGGVFTVTLRAGASGYRGAGATSAEISQALFPTKLKVNVRSSDRAVYVGTIRFHRNKNFEVHKVEIKDEYKEALRVYRKKYGTKVPLKKRIARRAK